MKQNAIEDQLVVNASTPITFFCKNCHETDWRHVDGKCLFETTSFEYSPRAQIVNAMCEHRFFGQHVTPALQAELTAFATALFEELARRGIPE